MTVWGGCEANFKEVRDDGPDGAWCKLEDGGHTMEDVNFARLEPKNPKRVAFSLRKIGLK